MHQSRGGCRLNTKTRTLAVLAAVWMSSQVLAADQWTEKSIAELRVSLERGEVTSAQLVEAYLKRIEEIDRGGPALHAVLAINPKAMEQAQALDAERKKKKLRGPLHGIPILLKDNIESLDPLPTTAGSLALRENITNRDAPIVANLRASGAVILGKTNLSEWANFRSTHSTSGWSGMGGLTRNPHVLDRSACGSSSGSGAAVAAGLAAGAVGTETDGSIVCPASLNGIVGVKPTLGLLSGERIVPISHSQDTAGPMTLTVTDAAIMLTAMVGAKPICLAAGCSKIDYAASLPEASLSGKRVGVLRYKADRSPQLDPLYAQALDQLKGAGAVLVEVDFGDTAPIDEAEETVLYTEFKTDLNAYLATTPPSVKARDLSQLIEFNRASPRELAVFNQEIFERADKSPSLDDTKYRTALATSKRLAGPEGISRVLTKDHLDFLVAATTGPDWRIDLVNGDQYTGSFSTLPAVAGYPHVTVPMGAVKNLPIGLSFIGEKWSEQKLLEAAFAYEQRSRARIAPQFLETVDTSGEATAPVH
ncbi:MAG: amidase [Povalibacter sp.]